MSRKYQNEVVLEEDFSCPRHVISSPPLVPLTPFPFPFKPLHAEIPGHPQKRRPGRPSPAPRSDLRNHSPNGFEWGYSGSGPAQLALASAYGFPYCGCGTATKTAPILVTDE